MFAWKYESQLAFILICMRLYVVKKFRINRCLSHSILWITPVIMSMKSPMTCIPLLPSHLHFSAHTAPMLNFLRSIWNRAGSHGPSRADFQTFLEKQKAKSPGDRQCQQGWPHGLPTIILLAPGVGLSTQLFILSNRHVPEAAQQAPFSELLHRGGFSLWPPFCLSLTQPS